MPNALAQFRAFLALDPQKPAEAVLLSAARKYYAACLFALSREAEAREALQQLLRDDPDARLDQSQFDRAFSLLFDQVLREMQPEIERLRTARVLSREQAEARRTAREQLVRRLVTTEVREERVPRYLMWFPFGIGQFATGQNVAGGLFLGAELLLLATTVTTLAWHSQFYPSAQGGTFRGPEESLFQQAQLAQGLEITNWVSASALFLVAVAGVAHANVTYRAVLQRTVVPRPMPQELEGARLVAGVGGVAGDPRGATLTLRLTF